MCLEVLPFLIASLIFIKKERLSISQAMQALQKISIPLLNLLFKKISQRIRNQWSSILTCKMELLLVSAFK